MENKLNQLRDLLSEEISLHESLKYDLQTEAEQDGHLDGTSLLRLQFKKNQKVSSLKEIEHTRIGLVKEIAKIWEVPPENLTLLRIIPRAPAHLGNELRECHSKLMGLVSDIKDLAKETSFNSQARLQAVEATLAVINEAIRLHPTYSGEGRLQKLVPTFKQTSA